MGRYVRALSPTAEFAIVIVGAFGLFIFASFEQAFSPRPWVDLSDAQIRSVLVYESVILVALSMFLHVRGWTPQRIGLEPHPRDFPAGLALAVAVHVAFLAAWLLTSSIFLQLTQPISSSTSVGPTLSLVNVMTVSVVNPLFEEMFVCGYVVSALRDRPSLWTAINVSAAIRLLYHLYQGALGVLTIVPTGLIFAYWYARTGRLWPAILAHALLNFIALAISAGG